MISKFKFKELNKKLKRERIEVCLNCQRMLSCNTIGKFEECMAFLENADENFRITKLNN